MTGGRFVLPPLLATAVAASGCGTHRAGDRSAADRPTQAPTKVRGSVGHSDGPYRLVRAPVVVAVVGAQGAPTEIDAYLRFDRSVPTRLSMAIRVGDAEVGGGNRVGYDARTARGHCYLASEAVLDDPGATLPTLRHKGLVDVEVTIAGHGSDVARISARAVILRAPQGDDSEGSGSPQRYAKLGCGRRAFIVAFPD